MNNPAEKKGLFKILRPAWYLDALLFWSIFSSCTLFMLWLLTSTTKSLLRENIATHTLSLTNMTAATLAADVHNVVVEEDSVAHTLQNAVLHLQAYRSENPDVLSICIANIKDGRPCVIYETTGKVRLGQLLSDPAKQKFFTDHIHAAQLHSIPRFSNWDFLKDTKLPLFNSRISSPEYSFKAIQTGLALDTDEKPVLIMAFDAPAIQEQFLLVDTNSGSVAGVAVLVATVLGMFVRWRSMQRIQATEEKLAVMALLRQRDAILAEISSGADEILIKPDLERVLEKMIFRIGTILEADACYACISSLSGNPQHGGTDPLLIGAHPSDATPLVLSDLDAKGMENWKQQLLNGATICEHDSTAGEHALIFMREHSQKSLALIPIRYESQLIGLLVLEQREASRFWEPSVLDSLRLAADLFGAAYARRDQELRLREGSKMQALGRMAAGVAHEFNNLLHIVTGNLSRLLKSPNRNDDITQLAGKIMEASQRGSRIVDQLLNATRQGLTDVQACDLNDLVQKTTALFHPAAKKTLHLELNLAPSLPEVLLDQSQLQQVILNLLLNASDAVDRDGVVKVTTGICDRHSNRAHGSYVFCEVLDNGCGFKESDLEHIFDPFFTTKPSGSGTGLGLSTTKGILEQHHGFIEAENALPHGARLTFYLPVHPIRCVSGLKTDSAPAVKNPATGLLLIADDEPLCLEVLGAYLQEKNCNYLTARDGNELLKVAREHKDEINWVITDWTMPGPVGEILVRELRQLLPSSCIIVASGFALNTGELPEVDALIQKPFTPDQLYHTLQQLSVQEQKNTGPQADPTAQL